MRFSRMGILAALAAAACSSAPVGSSRSAAPAPAEASKTATAITEADLRERLFAVAHDSMGGRFTGSVGHQKVVEYIAAEMKRLGLQPAGENGTYFQSVPFVRRSVAASELEGLELWDDYAPVYPGAPLRPLQNVQVVYGGNAQDTTTMITREQAAGKFVILTSRSPNPFTRGTNQGSRLETAAAVATIQSAGAMGLIRNFLSRPGPSYAGFDVPEASRGLVVALTADAASKLFGAAVDSTLTVGATGRTISANITFNEEPIVARNVVAVLPGSDARLKGQYVAIGAHSDHVDMLRQPVDHDSLRAFNAAVRAKRLEVGGRQLTPAERAEIKVNVDSLRAIRPARLDSINNGADDDGSGTVGVIEIAEAMAGMSVKPKRSVLFVWHVGEELGLHGARWFTENPTVPRDSIVAALNTDMIGRGGVGEEPGGGPTYLQLIGWRRLSNQLGDIIEAVNKEQQQPFTFDLQYDAAGHPEQFYCRSDHYMYARYNIPVAFFSTGGHGDYHQVTDEPQYIDYTKLRNVSQLVHDIALRVATIDQRPVVDGPKNDPKGQCRQ